MKRLIFFCSALSAVTVLGGCSLAKKIPVIGKKDGAEAVEATPPNGVPYGSDRALQTGDVIEVKVYKGLRSSAGLFDKVVTVGADGMVEIGKFGSAKVGGKRVADAASAIRSSFLRSARTSGARLTVHIVSVNGTKLVVVEGGVARPGVVLISGEMSVKDAIGAAGGKMGGAGVGFVYVSSRGVRKTLVLDGVSEGDPEAETKLRAGDVIDVPSGM